MTRKTDYELSSDLVFVTTLLACASFLAIKHIKKTVDESRRSFAMPCIHACRPPPLTYVPVQRHARPSRRQMSKPASPDVKDLRVKCVIPTRSCQKFSKQICLWDLAQSIGILFIIQIAEAI